MSRPSRHITIGLAWLGALALASVPAAAQNEAAGDAEVVTGAGTDAAAEDEAASGADGVTDAAAAAAPTEDGTAEDSAVLALADRLAEPGAMTGVGDRFAAWLATSFLAAKQRLPDGLRAAADALLQRAWSGERSFLWVQGAGAVIALLLLVRLLRGNGDLDISIEYPGELRGTFHVRVAKRRQGSRRGERVTSPAAAERAKRRAGTGRRTERAMVARETQFHLPARRWFVVVEGFVQAPESEEVLAAHYDEQEARVRRGHTVRVEFNFHPKECPLDVIVMWDRQPATQALVSLRGAPGSVRYARGGPVRMGVPRGRHVLVVGSGDRVAEVPIEIHSFEPTQQTLDLTDRDHLLFTGCPPAIEPYLAGDVPAAAQALERDGHAGVAALLLARHEHEQGKLESAAGHYEEAGQWVEAAVLRQGLSQFAAAAGLFERAGDSSSAAEMYRSAGDLGRAGEAFVQARDYHNAAECFRDADDVPRWIDALEKRGAHLEAAGIAIDRDDWPRAIRSLQQVPAGDAEYAEAARLLTDGYEHEGHFDLAARVLRELMETEGGEEPPLELCDRLARLLEAGGDFAAAIETLDGIRRRDVSWPNVATRIEELRKQASAASGATTAPPTEPPGEARYEILEQIGRGGMGVVFKARDRRLGRVVAMKRLTENLRDHPKAVELFLREARAAAALNHPNIVTLHDADQEGGSYYITMEFLEGHPLHRILGHRGKLGARDVARLGIQIASGLEYAHEQGVVHRDIKTSNLFFTKGKVVKIMDFGLAKMMEEVRRAATMIGGTPYYMAPEQSLGQPVDGRADLYALGVTFYELATGTLPFADGDVAYHHRHTAPADPRQHAEELPEELAALILEMLAKSPDERTASATRVREQLSAIAQALS